MAEAPRGSSCPALCGGMRFRLTAPEVRWNLPLAFSDPRTFAGVDKKVFWLGLDPGHKNFELWVLKQRFHRGVMPSQLGLRQHRMDLTVAHAVHERGLPSAFAPGHEVVCIALGGWDGPAAQGADHGNGGRWVQHLSPRASEWFVSSRSGRSAGSVRSSASPWVRLLRMNCFS